MKKIRLLNLLLVVSSLMSCHTDVLLEPEFPEYWMINGDTVRIREDIGKRYLSPHDFSTIIVGDTLVVPNYKKRIKQPLSKQNEELLKKGMEDPDLIGKPLRVIATGFFSRNGTAINNEEIEYSISNIIVNQMGVEFKNPYFDSNDFNGVFTYVPTTFNPTGGPVPKFKAAKNNLAIDYFEKDGSPVLRKLNQDRVDNLLLFTDEKTWLERLNSKLNYEQTVLHEKFDFMINISPNDDYMMNKGLEDYEPWKPLKSPWDQSYRSAKLDMLSEIIKRKGVKGILINSRITTPSLMLELIPVEDVRKELEKYQKGRLLDKDAVIIYPTSKIDSLLGTNVNMNLKPYISRNEKILDYSSTDPQKRIEVYDRPKRSKLAEQLNWPELDVNYIHTQIYLGKYISPDGVKINYKDIYEEDFLNFSKLRNIILANEALKTINEYYGTSFSYINTREFLK
ncbi:hypothetical protein, partial [Leadbetterella sp. DM7]|uniref:hypothetical protein n=1 Tax=Leadbetterella sp. DM7 TaxID=3235085 RepID=UPI00349E9464